MTDTIEDAARLATLAAYAIVDTRAEASYDGIVKAAAEGTSAPIAMISLVEAERQWFKARIGLEPDQTSIGNSICAVAIRSGDETFVVPDASKDERFRDFDVVTGDPHIRFYAGAPLKMRDGVRIGTLCVIDAEPRAAFAEEDRLLLEELARRTVAALELRRDLREGGLTPEPSTAPGALWLDVATAALDRAAAALSEVDATVQLAQLDTVIDQVRKLREAADERRAAA